MYSLRSFIFNLWPIREGPNLNGKYILSSHPTCWEETAKFSIDPSIIRLILEASTWYYISLVGNAKQGSLYREF